MARNVWETDDKGCAAYAKLHGLTLLGCRENRGTYYFQFDDPEGIGQELQLKYLNSDYLEFDSIVRSLVQLIKGSSRRGRRN